MFSNYLLITWRNLMRNKIFSLINLLGLAIGMAACIMILQYVGFEMSFDTFFQNKADIYRVIGKDLNSDTKYPVTRPDVAPGIAASFPEVVAATRMFPRDGTMSYDDGEQILAFREENYSYADEHFFAVFGLPTPDPEALNKPFSILLSASSAARYFGEANPLGKVLTLHDDFGHVDYTVRGTYPDLPQNSHIQPDFLVSFHQLEGDIGEQYNLSGWSAFFSYVRLLPDTDPSVLNAKFPVLIAQAVGEDSGYDMELQPLAAIHLHSGFAYDRAITGNLERVYFLLTLSIFILLLAWVNYVNLSTSRALDRAREVGIRKLLGSIRIQLIGQFLLESLLLNALAAIAGITLVQVFAPTVYELTGIEGIPAGWLFISPAYALALGGFFLLGALIAGIYPAWVLSSPQAASVLSGNFGRSPRGLMLRKVLVVLQFGVAAVLITGTFAAYRQLSFMRNQELGMDIEQQFAIESPSVTDSTYQQQMEVLKNSLQAIPGVEALIGSGVLPGTNFNYGTGGRLPGQPKEANKSCQIAYVQAGFFRHFSIPLRYGRGFAPNPDSDGSNAIVNEALLAQFGLPVSEAVIGQTLLLGNQNSPATIIGVVPNYHHESLQYGFEPIVYQHQPATSYLALKLHSSGAQLPALLAEIEATYREIFPGNPYTSLFLDEVFAEKYREDQRFSSAFGLFAGLAILIAALGLIGLASARATQRTKEIGVRKILGASNSDVLLLLSREFILLVLVAGLVAMPFAFIGINWWLEKYAFRMDLSPLLFLLPTLLMVALAALTVAVLTLKTARANPVDALRYE